MKRLLPVLLAVALLVPGAAMAKGKKVSAKKAKGPAIESEKCSGDKDVKNVSLGKEVVFVSEDLKSASFSKDEKNTLKHNLCYYDAKSGYNRRTPGMSPDGDALVPAFKHGETWHVLSRVNDAIVVDGGVNPTEAAVAPAAPAGDMIVAPEKKAKTSKKGKKGGKKGGKKAKGSKKEKKEKTEKKVEEKPAADAPAAAPAEKK
ncbi:MAG: hypothetical protein HQM09_09420 [Candidatus Riflebacteria bacterium]|nr:hypothetical protein [Candidatus Riflebacteria bacterium]